MYDKDDDADASVGNVTGSNCVNVFLGIGLPWMLCSFYWLGMGADDYITKPFSQRLLLARIRAVLRRVSDGVMRTSGPNIIRLGELLMDPDRHLCSWRGQEVKLTVTEFLILQALASRPGMVKNRDQLMDAAYGESIFLDDRTIDSHIKRLRRKLRAHDSDFDQIETLYGIGYKYKTSSS